VTVTNLSGRLQQDTTISLDRANILGAHPFDASDPLTRNIPSLPAGGAETLEYRLVADVSGHGVPASTFRVDVSLGAGHDPVGTGIGEKGIPLSPVHLVLPRHAYGCRSRSPRRTSAFWVWPTVCRRAGASPPDLPSCGRRGDAARTIWPRRDSVCT
jgi:hypothetical protein